MDKRPYVLLSCAVSLDGYIDDTSDARLMLSNEADFDRVDQVRAGCDAILIGTNTIRKDNPRLLVRGATATPVKVTITGRGDLDPAAQFFLAGETEKIVYAASSAVDKAAECIGAVATVVDAGDPVDLLRVLDDLAARGIARLMVEGGGIMHTQFLTAGLADELQLVIAPFFVGDSQSPRFVYNGAFLWNRDNRARLAEVTPVGDVVLLRYALSERYGG